MGLIFHNIRPIPTQPCEDLQNKRAAAAANRALPMESSSA